MKAPAAWWRATPTGAEIRVRVTPNASRDAIEGLALDAAGVGHVRVKVRAVPEKGKANAAVELLLARALGVAKSAVAVDKGASDRVKTVSVTYKSSSSDGERVTRLILELAETKA